MYSTGCDGSKGCRVRQNRGLRCALAAMMVGMGAAQAYAQCLEEQKLTASDALRDGFFGGSVSVNGDTAMVASSGEPCAAGGTHCGSVFVYGFNGTSWVEEQKLAASDGTAADTFGDSVSLSGDRVVVGASTDDCSAGRNCGSAYVFRFDGTAWVEEQKLTASDAAAEALFGFSVSVSGDTALVGAKLDDCTPGSGPACGSAYVYHFNGSSWVEEQKLTASDAKSFAEFGGSVSLSGETAIVGAAFSDCAGSDLCGAAYVFRSNGTAWVEEQKLTAADGDFADEFGSSVSISGEAAVVGAVLDDFEMGGDFGSAYVYRFNGTRWVEEQKLTAFDATGSARFGFSVSVSGDITVVGASENGDGTAHVYRFNGSSWGAEQEIVSADESVTLKFFGYSVSMSAGKVLIGAPRSDCELLPRCGSAHVFGCLPACGNGSHDLGEQCDGGVGCTGCLCDPGFEPTSPRSADCQPTCGNGRRNLGEACDGVNDSACPGFCLSDCTCGPFCGNGACDPGEDSCSCTTDCGTPASHELAGATCEDGLDNDCDGSIDSDDPDCPDEPIPTVSQWGMIFTTLLLLAIGKIVFKRTARGAGTVGAMPKP